MVAAAGASTCRNVASVRIDVTPQLIGVALTALLAVLAVGVEADAQSVRIQALSNRPDMVSGGDVLVRVDAPPAVAPASLKVTLNGADVTASLRPDPAGQRLTGLVTGLRPGSNELIATASAGRHARLTVVNFPITGPVFSGPHEQPFICETDAFRLRSGGTLGPAIDAACSTLTRVDYAYRSSAGGELKPLPDRSAPPADVATVTTAAGGTVPYIVRIETGTINRAIYQIAMLHDPTTANPDFLTRSQGWNGKLFYTFGGGCAGGWYRQGRSTGGVEDDTLLRLGYAIASASLNVAGNNCSEALAAETMMMVKERFVEAYGPPLFTIGMGTSGGSYQSLQIADNYPGLLDGIIIGRMFPEVNVGIVNVISDARLLERYFGRTAVPYTDDQKRQITGFSVLASLTQENLNPGRIHVTEFCPDVLPQTLRYHPVDNPRGARCDVFDHAVNVFGRDPKTGFSRRPLDNEGVQYGLAALNAGAITKDQFLDLNAQIGGYDQDGNVVSSRSVGDPVAIRATYRSGRLTYGGNGLATTPVIDYRAYWDDAPEGDIHLRFHSFSLQERLRKVNGHLDNHVMLTEDRRNGAFSLRSPVLLGALKQMDEWLTSIRSSSEDGRVATMRSARPAGLVSACWTRDAEPRKIVEPQNYGSGECAKIYPPNSSPRGVAGSPVTSDIVKCQLKPVIETDYTVRFTPDEMTRLKTLFPHGVCDWTKPGVGQEKPAGVWQRY